MDTSFRWPLDKRSKKFWPPKCQLLPNKNNSSGCHQMPPQQIHLWKDPGLKQNMRDDVSHLDLWIALLDWNGCVAVVGLLLLLLLLLVLVVVVETQTLKSLAHCWLPPKDRDWVLSDLGMLRDLSRLAKSTDFLKQVVVPERERERERMGKQA